MARSMLLITPALFLGFLSPSVIGHYHRYLSDGTLIFDEDLDDRKSQYLDYVAQDPDPFGSYKQNALIARNFTLSKPAIREALDDLLFQDTLTTGDFRAVSFVRLLYLSDIYPNGLDDEITAEIEYGLQIFKYWFDDPRTEIGITNTENHQITFHTAAYLAGQRFPNVVFESGKTGIEHMETTKPLILQWFRDRERFGFSEWLSAGYYGVNVGSILTLVDFCEDEEIQSRAVMAMDLLVYDLALHSYMGYFGPTTGRSRGAEARFSSSAIITTSISILFDVGFYRSTDEQAASALATSIYQVPKVFVQIAQENSITFVTKQRNGIFVEEGPDYGIGYTNLEDGIFWGGMGAEFNPLVFPLTIELMAAYQYDAFLGFDYSNLVLIVELLRLVPSLVQFVAGILRPILIGLEYSQANIVTYRSPGGMLSSVQDKMKGLVGFSQLAWQATLGRYAIVTTIHPGAPFFYEDGGLVGIWGDEWSGGASMPRIAQSENVAIIIYNPYVFQFYPDYTHAYFPKKEFAEVRMEGHWTMARTEDGGYIALYSSTMPEWQSVGIYANRELIAQGTRNIWICEMAHESDYGSFNDFASNITSSEIEIRSSTLEVTYHSPSQGALKLDWDSPYWVVDGTRIDLSEPHPRYDNPFSYMEWGADVLDIEHNGLQLQLDFDQGTRTAGG